MKRKYVRREKGGHTYHIVPENLAPDKNNQYLQQLSYPEDEWMNYDTWEMVTAIKLITLGSNLDLEELAEYAKDMDFNSPGKDVITTMHEVYSRALRIAESSIVLGKINDPDTPKNWIDWAMSKGYKIDHLDPSKRIHNLEKLCLKTEIETLKEFYQDQIDAWNKLKNRSALLESETKTDTEKKKIERNQIFQKKMEAMAAAYKQEGKISQATKGRLAAQLAKEYGLNPATIERNTRKTW